MLVAAEVREENPAGPSEVEHTKYVEDGLRGSGFHAVGVVDEQYAQ